MPAPRTGPLAENYPDRGRRIENVILDIRGQKVVLDADLARLYGVTTKRLNEQVKRNSDRFPADFMFKLTDAEKAGVVERHPRLARLRFSPVLPCAFTEHGAVMVASVLSSERAVEVSVFVVRAFVRMRLLLATHRELVQKLSELERRVAKHDVRIAALFDAVRQLMQLPTGSRRPD
jgi:hypothetical protein